MEDKNYPEGTVELLQALMLLYFESDKENANAIIGKIVKDYISAHEGADIYADLFHKQIEQNREHRQKIFALQEVLRGIAYALDGISAEELRFMACKTLEDLKDWQASETTDEDLAKVK